MTESTHFRKQVEQLLGREITVVWESVLHRESGIKDRAEFRRRLESETRVLDLQDVMAGTCKANGLVFFVASLQRGGVLIQLREIPQNRSSKNRPCI